MQSRRSAIFVAAPMKRANSSATFLASFALISGAQIYDGVQPNECTPKYRSGFIHFAQTRPILNSPIDSQCHDKVLSACPQCCRAWRMVLDELQTQVAYSRRMNSSWSFENERRLPTLSHSAQQRKARRTSRQQLARPARACPAESGRKSRLPRLAVLFAQCGLTRLRVLVGQNNESTNILTSDRDYAAFFSNPAHKNAGRKRGMT